MTQKPRSREGNLSHEPFSGCCRCRCLVFVVVVVSSLEGSYSRLWTVHILIFVSCYVSELTFLQLMDTNVWSHPTASSPRRQQYLISSFWGIWSGRSWVYYFGVSVSSSVKWRWWQSQPQNADGGSLRTASGRTHAPHLCLSHSYSCYTAPLGDHRCGRLFSFWLCGYEGSRGDMKVSLRTLLDFPSGFIL